MRRPVLTEYLPPPSVYTYTAGPRNTLHLGAVSPQNRYCRSVATSRFLPHSRHLYRGNTTAQHHVTRTGLGLSTRPHSATAAQLFPPGQLLSCRFHLRHGPSPGARRTLLPILIIILVLLGNTKQEAVGIT